jgi:hypothetical protein
MALFIQRRIKNFLSMSREEINAGALPLTLIH